MERYVVHIDVGTFHAPWLEASAAFPRPDSQDCVPHRTMPFDRKFAAACRRSRSARFSRDGHKRRAPRHLTPRASGH
ncbi:hypothetical protein DIE23_18195 [Burkholderia sp. Bp9143]|nr:hypothetical protein DIE23_18195 [Burkholderia sp. Bp9143]